MAARRYNKGKLRLGLIPAHALTKIAEVYTKGAHKYTDYKKPDGTIVSGKDIPAEDAAKYEVVYDGSDNWREGQLWLESLDSVKRHISAFELGEDIDELGTLHLGNAVWGLIQLIEYYKIFPQGDNRKHKYLSFPKVGLDIDEVLCDFITGWHKRWGADPSPQWWNYHRGMGDCFQKMKDEGSLDDFYLSLKPKINPADIPFEPECYVTSRPVGTDVTEKWLEMHGFPAAKVHTVPVGGSKVEVIKSAGIDIFIDDSFANFSQLNKAGICCFLFDAPHNSRYEIGYKRIKSLKDLF